MAIGSWDHIPIFWLVLFLGCLYVLECRLLACIPPKPRRILPSTLLMSGDHADIPTGFLIPNTSCV